MPKLIKLVLICHFVVVLSQVAGRAVGQDADIEGFQATDVDDSFGSWTGRVEFQLWWTKGNPVPALATFSPDGTLRPDAGVLGTSGVEVLAGDEQLDGSVRPGGRVTLTRQFAAFPSLALDASVFFIGDGRPSRDFYQFSDGASIISRPFYNAVETREDAELVAYPEVLAGAVTVHSTSEIVSPEVSLRYELSGSALGRVHVLGGYRYFRLRESLSIREDLISIDQGGLIPLGTTTNLEDHFVTRNEFHGGELGVSVDFEREYVTLAFLAKVALGNVHRVVDIQGNTVVTIPDLPATTTAGGLLTQPTNMGQYRSNQFGVLPEFGATTKVRLTRRVDFVAGYSLLFLNGVARSGAQIDREVNPSQIGGEPLAGVARPRFELAESDFWAHSLNLGVEYRW